MIAALLALALAAPAAARAEPVAPVQRVDALFARWNRQTTPGCTLEVQQNELVLARRAYGSADLEHGAPIRETSVFEAGSVSKQFTAATILLLAEDGRLNLDDDVRRYVPELPDYGTPIRLRHLLNHTSGLRDWGAIAALTGWPRGTAAYDMDDVIAIIVRQKKLNFAPGSEYSYSNSGYNLLAIVVARVSGTTFASFTAERLFRPLGMNATGWRTDFRRIQPGRAIAYAARGQIYEQDMPFENSIGNGGLLTTVGDLSRWSAALLGNRVGRNVAAELAQRGTLSDGTSIRYARGLMVGSLGGVPELSHTGVTASYHAWLGLYPSARLSIALLCSAGDANAPVLGQSVAAIFLPPIKATPRPPAASVAAQQWAGLYLDAHDQPLTLVDDHGALRIAGGGTLFPLSADRFRLGDDSEIALAPTGTAQLVTPDGPVRYRRIAPPPASVGLAPYAGRFASEEVGAVYQVTVVNREIRLKLESRPQIELRARLVGADLFEAQGAIVRYLRGAGGAIDGLAISVPRAFDVRFDRIAR